MFLLQCLGTSSGVPTKIRNVSGMALTLPNSKAWVLIDCGEGTQHQLLHCKLSLTSLKAIFITHVHGDHCYGLPGLIASAAMSRRTEPLLIVGPKEIETMYLAIKEATQLFTPFDINFIQTTDLGTLEIDNTSITAIELSHRVPSHAFSFRGRKETRKLLTKKLDRDEIPRGPIWGELQNNKDVQRDDGSIIKSNDYVEVNTLVRKVIISGDNDSPELLSSEAVDADLLVHEATYTDEVLQKVGTGPQHSSAQQVSQFAEKVNLPNLLLTHFSARFQERGKENGIGILEDEARLYYKGNLFLAEDFNRYQLRDDGQLILVNE